MSALVAKLLIAAYLARLALVPGVCWAVEHAVEAPVVERTCCQRHAAQLPAQSSDECCPGGSQGQVQCCCQTDPAIPPAPSQDTTPMLSWHPLAVASQIGILQKTALLEAPWEVGVDWRGTARQARLCVWRL